MDGKVNVEFEGFEEGDKKGGKKEKKRGHEGYDMTPMTDLAFLLLTFFMITTTFAKPQIMEVMMPEESENDKTTIKESQTLNIVLAENDQIYWYTGITDQQVKKTSYRANGIRQLLLDKSSQVKDLNVLIKPTKESRYKNLVDILDEMNIANIEKYAVIDATKEDNQLINQA